MFVRKCDVCGRDGTVIADKNFISFNVNIEKFTANFDFCPECWGKYGGEFMNIFSSKSEENEEK